MSGRPSKYKSEYKQMLIDYFGIEPNFDVIEQKKDGNGCFYTKKVKKPNVLPTFYMFADMIGISRDTLYEWANPKNIDKYPDFSYTYKRAKAMQKDFLIQNGLLKLYPSNFAIFILKASTDMR